MQAVEKTGNDSCSVRWWRVGSKSKETQPALSRGSALSLTLTEAKLSISDSRSFELSMNITFYFATALCQHDTFVFRGCFEGRCLRIDTSSILQRGMTIPKRCVHINFDMELTLFEHFPIGRSGSLERRQRVRRSISSNTAHLFGAMQLPLDSPERQHRCTLMHKTQYVTCDLNFEVGFPKAAEIPTPRIPSLGAVCKQLSGRTKRYSSFKYKHQYSNEEATTTAGVSSHERLAQSSNERSIDRSWRADYSSVDGPGAILSQVVSVNTDGWDDSESSSSYVAHYAKVDRFKPSGFESGTQQIVSLDTKRSGPSLDELKKLTSKRMRRGHGLEKMKRTDTHWWGTAKTKQITKKKTLHELSEQPQRFDERRMGKFAAMTSDIC
ncbi:MAG: hypothetical protein KVP17_002586 [Porospora cf. gigantea B]|uniref:uncharacterized protein n=1 Tax=Porospora cf. gigantea B TaxID=2853592 RepID=UPI003571869F|nr:MAG: hypothetical protein KVP17_002586 [Porospora cf. gigantea B]